MATLLEDKNLVLRHLLWPAYKQKYEVAEGNVESIFASRLLTDFAEVPLDWIFHQHPVAGGRTDISVIVNGVLVLVVECKRARQLVTKANNAVYLREPLNQALGYSFTIGAPLILVTDSRHLALIDRHRLVITATTPDEILDSGPNLLKRLRPEYLYYLSRNIMPPAGATEAVKLLGKAWSLDFGFDVEAELDRTQSEFLDYANWASFRDEILSWLSLWQHYRESSNLEGANPNSIVHIDYSFVSYFEGSWYYDRLHSEVTRIESELTQKAPGLAFRVFVLSDRKQLIKEFRGLRGLIRHQLAAGYRCGLLYNDEWREAGIAESHVDLVGNVFAKVYFEVDKVLNGEVVDSRKKVRRLRKQVLDVVYHHGRVFEPLALCPTTFDRVDECLEAELRN